MSEPNLNIRDKDLDGASGFLMKPSPSDNNGQWLIYRLEEGGRAGAVVADVSGAAQDVMLAYWMRLANVDGRIVEDNKPGDPQWRVILEEVTA